MTFDGGWGSRWVSRHFLSLPPRRNCCCSWGSSVVWGINRGLSYVLGETSVVTYKKTENNNNKNKVLSANTWDECQFMTLIWVKSGAFLLTVSDRSPSDVRPIRRRRWSPQHSTSLLFWSFSMIVYFCLFYSLLTPSLYWIHFWSFHLAVTFVLVISSWSFRRLLLWFGDFVLAVTVVSFRCFGFQYIPPIPGHG